MHEDGRGESIWDRFCHTPGRIQGGDTGDVACDHYHRYRQDVALMAQLGVTSYRFSVAWPRVLPRGAGPVNRRGLDFYRRLAEELLRQGIRPLATLYHWDLPQALQDRGGWPARETAERFAAYAMVVAGALGDLVQDWVTLNEPWVVANVGYRWGTHAPGLRDPLAAARARQHLLLAHGLAVQALRAGASRPARVGITLNLSPVYAVSNAEGDLAAARLADGFLNRAYLDPVLRGHDPEDVRVFGEREDSTYDRLTQADLAVVRAPIDFLGVNYYSPWYVAGPPATMGTRSGHHPVTAMGWEIVPGALTDLLLRIRREYGSIPIMITENGAAFVDQLDGRAGVEDGQRVRFLRDHIGAVHRAIAAGADVRGYYAWSLLDNFEWAEGYSKRFGLCYTRFATQQRIPKASARWYQAWIRDQGRT